MMQNRVSQLVSSLGIETVWYNKLFMESWYSWKEHCWFSIPKCIDTLWP